MRFKSAGLLWLGLALLAGSADAAPRVFSLDQCADQFVLAMASRDTIVGLSPRAGDPDFCLRARSQGLPRRRATSEAVLAARPQVVVRFWGGDARLTQTLARRGVRVVRIEEAADFDAVRANIRRVAAALEAPARGEALIARMDAQLRGASGVGRGRKALYLTPGGFTTGPGTLIDAMLRAAGYANAAAAPGYDLVSLEDLVMRPPNALVLGFFDVGGGAQQSSWGVGRHAVLQGLIRSKAIVSLPAAVLGCPAWFAGDAVAALGAARPPS